MKKYYVLYLFSILMLLASRIEARAVPQEIGGVNIAGLHADLKTNLFAPDGPLAQLGKEIASSADQLQKELANGAQALQNDMRQTKDFLGQGTQEEVAGVNIAGLHAGIKTNLFSQDGPLAQVGNDLAQGEKQLEDDFTKGANALGASLMDATNAMQAQLANGLKGLEQKIPPATRGSSLDDLDDIKTDSDPQDKAGDLNPLRISEVLSDEPSMTPGRSSRIMININPQKPGQDPPSNQNDEETNSLQGDNDLSDLFKNMKLPNLFDNSQGVPENLNTQNLLDVLAQGFKSLSELPAPDLSAIFKDVGVPNLSDNSQGIPEELNPLKLFDQLADGLKSLSGIPPPDISGLFKNVELPNLVDNKGIPDDLNPQILLDQLAQGFKSLSELAEGGELPFNLPNIDLSEAVALPELLKIPPLPLNGLVLDEAVEALPAIAALSVI